MAKKISTEQNSNYLGKIENEIQSNQSKLSMVLGALIILVVGILVFNYFNRSKSDLGPAQTTTTEQQDVTPANLPGKYIVKEDDTLFIIAQKYYNDGYKYTEIAKANNLDNPDLVEKGQIIEIPKLESATEMTLPVQPEPLTVVDDLAADTQWGPKITSTTYTVVEGDWLSKIAGRSYGDIMEYDKIAKANNIQNSDLIEPGMVLTIPR